MTTPSLLMTAPLPCMFAEVALIDHLCSSIVQMRFRRVAGPERSRRRARPRLLNHSAKTSSERIRGVGANTYTRNHDSDARDI